MAGRARPMALGPVRPGAPDAAWQEKLAARAQMAKDCADCGVADCGLELANLRFRDLGPPRGQ
eukprot:10680412-Alexandrium_andersonii.AAC.1